MIGVSWGGMVALRTILPYLNNNFSLPIVIVQHVSECYSHDDLNVWRKYCKLPVKHVEDKEKIKNGHIYFAPAGYHVIIEHDFSFSLDSSEPVCFARPSVDVLFESGSFVLGPKVMGIILTGANTDGAHGLQSVREGGGVTVVQNPDSAECSEMPRAAIAVCDVDYILNLDEIGRFLAEV